MDRQIWTRLINKQDDDGNTLLHVTVDSLWTHVRKLNEVNIDLQDEDLPIFNSEGVP